MARRLLAVLSTFYLAAAQSAEDPFGIQLKIDAMNAAETAFKTETTKSKTKIALEKAVKDGPTGTEKGVKELFYGQDGSEETGEYGKAVKDVQDAIRASPDSENAGKDLNSLFKHLKDKITSVVDELDSDSGWKHNLTEMMAIEAMALDEAYHGSTGLQGTLSADSAALKQNLTQLQSEFTNHEDSAMSQTASKSLEAYENIEHMIDGVTKAMEEAENNGAEQRLFLKRQMVSSLSTTTAQLDQQTRVAKQFKRDVDDASREIEKWDRVFDVDLKKELRKSSAQERGARRQIMLGVKGTGAELEGQISQILASDRLARKTEKRAVAKSLKKSSGEFKKAYKAAKREWKKTYKSSEKELKDLAKGAARLGSFAEDAGERVGLLQRADASAVTDAAEMANDLKEDFEKAGARNEEQEFKDFITGYKEVAKESRTGALNAVNKFEKTALRDYESKATRTLIDGNTGVQKQIEELDRTMGEIHKLNQDEEKKPKLDEGMFVRVEDIKNAEQKKLEDLHNQVYQDKLMADFNDIRTKVTGGVAAKITELQQDIVEKKQALQELPTQFLEGLQADGTTYIKDAGDKEQAVDSAFAANDQKMSDIASRITQYNADALAQESALESMASSSSSGSGDGSPSIAGVEQLMETAKDTISEQTEELKDKYKEEVKAELASMKKKFQDQEKSFQKDLRSVSTKAQDDLSSFRETAREAREKGSEDLANLEQGVGEEKENLAHKEEDLRSDLDDAQAELDIEKQKSADNVAKLEKQMNTAAAMMRKETATQKRNIESMIPNLMSTTTALQEIPAQVEAYAESAKRTTKQSLKDEAEEGAEALKSRGSLVKKTIQDAKDKLAQQTRAYTEFAKVAKTVDVASLAQAKGFFAGVELLQKKLDLANIAGEKDKAKAEKLLQERIGKLQTSSKAMLNDVGSAMSGLVDAAGGDYAEKVTAIMNKETSSKDEREAQLKAAEDEYNTKIRALQAQARTAARDGDALAAQQQQSAKAASADVTAASGDVKSADTAEARAQLEAEAAMNNEGSKELSHAEIMVNFLASVRDAVHGRVASARKAFDDKLGLAKHDIEETSLAAANRAVDEIKTMQKDITASGNGAANLFGDNADLINGFSSHISASVNATQGELAAAAEAQQAAFATDLGTLQKDTEASLQGMAQTIIGIAHQLQAGLANASSRAAGAAARRADAESSLSRLANLTTVGLGIAKAEEVVRDGKALFDWYHRTGMWWAGFKAHDLGFKRLIAQKLKDFGVEIEMDQVEGAAAPPRLNGHALESGVTGALSAERQKMSKELTALYGDYDDQIAAVLRNQHLSEAERRARVKELQAEAEQRAQQLFHERRELRARQAAVEAELARYARLVEAAEAAANAGIAAGHLSPEVAGVQTAITEAGRKLARLKASKLLSGGAGRFRLSSFLQQSGNMENLRKLQLRVDSENEKLAKEDAQLEDEVDRLERRVNQTE